MLTQLPWDIMPFLALTLSMTWSFVMVTCLYLRAKIQAFHSAQHILARWDSASSQYHILRKLAEPAQAVRNDGVASQSAGKKF